MPQVIGEKPRKMTPLGRPVHGWEDNIRMNVREIGWAGMQCSGVAQDNRIRTGGSLLLTL
jgi:hypothetical protein